MNPLPVLAAGVGLFGVGLAARDRQRRAPTRDQGRTSPDASTADIRRPEPVLGLTDLLTAPDPQPTDQRGQAMDLQFYSPGDFRSWWDQMSPQLLRRLDAFRRQWGAPVRISPVNGAIGRRDDTASQHNVSRWGEVRAIDVFPDGMDGPSEAREARRIAQRVGFTGIGVYPPADPSPMLHLDVRNDRSPSNPAEWTALRADGGGWDYRGPSVDQQPGVYV